MQKNHSSNQALMFFIIYMALLGSLIFAAVTFKPTFQQEQPSEISSVSPKNSRFKSTIRKRKQLRTKENGSHPILL